MATCGQVSSFLHHAVNICNTAPGLSHRDANSLLIWERPPDTLFSAASAMAVPASCLFGFLSAAIAFCSSASTSAFLLSFETSPALLLLREKELVRVDLRRPQSDFMRGILASDCESLPSFFSPGIATSVAESSAATALLGPRDILRRSRCAWSVEKAR